jgi:hypothetical protein
MKAQQIKITLPQRARIALEVLAERNGISPGTQARILLRQALARTMDSAEVQAKTTAPRMMTRSEWQQEQAAIAEDLAIDAKLGSYKQQESEQ